MKKLVVDCMVRVGCDGCPESYLYIACGMDMRVWEAVRSVMVESKLLIIKGNWAELTETAKSILSECRAQ